MVAQPERKDPFEQLLEACQVALDFVKDRHERAIAESGKRGEQRSRIEGAMAILSGAAAPPKAKKATTPSTGTRGGARTCPECGGYFNSQVHRAHKDQQAAAS